jgi:hypothetical protein
MAVGGGAKLAIPELVKLLDDPNTAADAVQILKDLDNEVIPALLFAATNQEQRLRAMVLWDRIPPLPQITPALVAGAAPIPIRSKPRRTETLRPGATAVTSMTP